MPHTIHSEIFTIINATQLRFVKRLVLLYLPGQHDQQVKRLTGIIFSPVVSSLMLHTLMQGTHKAQILFKNNALQ